ncbi:nitrilase-related carbon-nitrogen hydrolase [Pseudomonas thivervalensis]|uniref:nitrilase-related carbon-nitrogen hydrolase n=1 Tax=Pseudomonas thivervalensis TaxID=86265 RepID=UPI00209FC078|nr:nitrilase-related carbon-nitrogen hydrolase [Pseudomonas thivervalensis]
MTSKREKTVAIVQMPAALLDRAESMRRAAEHINKAALQKAQLVIFPETWLSGYPAWVFGMAGWDDAQAKSWYAKLLADSPVIGLPDDRTMTWRSSARLRALTLSPGYGERAFPAP